jgi:APA family basic amino acid/polyamine antiporter
VSARPAAISLYTATCLVVANMIGTGVFTSVGFQLAGGLTPFPILMLWLVGGICAFCGGVAYAELAAALPRSGGEYHFLARIYHPSVGFLAGWVSLTAGFAAPVALAAIAFGKYLQGVWPGLSAPWLADGAVLAVTALLLATPRLRVIFQDGATSLKGALLVIFIVFGWAAAGEGSSLRPQPGDGAQLLSGDFAVSLVFVMYAYAGWNASAYLAGEVRNPARNVPLSMALGTIVVGVLYLAINAVFLYLAPAAELRGQTEVGLIAGQHAFGPHGGRAVALLIAVGLLSNMGAMQWIGPRVMVAMGQDHPALRPLSGLNRRGLPLAATLAQTALVFLLMKTGSFQDVLTYVQVTITFCSFLTVLGVFILRWREPELPRPIRAWGYPVTPLIFLLVNGWMMAHAFVQNPLASGKGLATIVCGWLVYHFTTRSRK